MKCLALAVVLLIGLATLSQADFQGGLRAYLRGDYATTHQEFKPLAEQGNSQAQWFLGSMYEKGQGVPQDYAEAVKWHRKAAEQGLAEAQFSLGVMYYGGQGVPQDYAEAVKWHRKAAEQGLAAAQFGLGLMYKDGRGVPRDYVQAHMWYTLAALRSPSGLIRDAAVRHRDIIAERMTPAQIAEAQRLAREWKPKAIKELQQTRPRRDEPMQ